MLPSAETGAGCQVSVIMACRNVERYLDAAILSARRQSLAEIEILVVDDRSTDGTRACAERHAAADGRVRVFEGPGRGPGAARNIALGHAKGDWLAILDGDDFMHPRRLELLLAQAAMQHADMIADNLFVFHNPNDPRPPNLLLTGASWQTQRFISLADYLESNMLMVNRSPLGYLKPLISRQLVAEGSVNYDESLRIAEDCDLVIRLLTRGAKFAYAPYPLYFYRRHDRSTSYRIMPADIAAIIAAADRSHAALPANDAGLRTASTRRQNGLRNAAQFAIAREQLKNRQWFRALNTLVSSPPPATILLGAVHDTISRRIRGWLSRGKGFRTGALNVPSRALVIWSGTTAEAERVRALLSNQGMAVEMVVVRLQTGVFPDCAPSLLLKIARTNAPDIVIYDREEISYLVPYALSPQGRAVIWRPEEQLQTTHSNASGARGSAHEREQPSCSLESFLPIKTTAQT